MAVIRPVNNLNTSVFQPFAKIAELGPNRSNFVLDAVVIAKTPVHWFGDTGINISQPQAPVPSFFVGAQKQTNRRCVTNLTIRDSISDFVKLSIWSDCEDTVKSIQIGDVVRIIGCKVSPKRSLGSEDRFAPATPKMVELSISLSVDSQASIYVIGRTEHPLAALLHQPVRDPSDFMTLSQIMRMGQRLDGQCVNLLVVVCLIGTERHVKSRRDGQDLVCCDLHVLDATSVNFIISLWNPELIAFAQSRWQRNEIVFFTDIQLKYDEKFGRGLTGVSMNKTIAIPRPEVPDAERLRQLIESDVADVYGVAASQKEREPDLDISKITEQFTVEQTQSALSSSSTKMNEFLQQQTGTIFSTSDQLSQIKFEELTHYGFLFGYITRLPVVSPTADFSKLACTNCGRYLEESPQGGSKCGNSRCRVTFGQNVSESEWRFRLSIHVSDYTGTLRWLQLSDSTAQRLVGVSVQQLIAMTVEERSSLKWKLLFEKVKLYFKIQPSQVSGRVSICVVDVQPADPLEMCGLALAIGGPACKNFRRSF